MGISWELVEDHPTADEWLIRSPTPWERMPGETDLQWERFLTYRNMGPARTIPALAHELGVDLPNLYPQSAKNNWLARAAAYDFHLDEIYRHEVAEHTKQMARRHAAISEKALTALALPIEVLLSKDPEQVLEELDREDIMKLYDLIGKTVKTMPSIMASERLAYGAPTDISKREEEHTFKLDTDDEEQLANVLRAVIGTNILDDLRGEGTTGEIVDAEVYELHPSDTPPETDSLPARTTD